MSLTFFSHLLPRSDLWKLWNGSNLKNLIESLDTGFPFDTKAFLDGVWQNIFPQTTVSLDEWEAQFGFTPGSLTDQERRDRLDAAWKRQPNQSPRYIQDAIWDQGFTNVTIHEFWDPLSPPTPRDPTVWLGNGNPGYILRNKITDGQVLPLRVCLAGDTIMNAGDSGGSLNAQAGEFSGFGPAPIEDPQPTTDPATWAYYLYFGDATFGSLADVPATRRGEFEDLLLRICPTQQWLGLFINYV